MSLTNLSESPLDEGLGVTADGTAVSVAVSAYSCQFGCFLLEWVFNEEKVKPNLKECEYLLNPQMKWNMGIVECASNKCFIRFSCVSQW